MAYTYTWDSLLAVSTKLYKDIPITALDATICDMVSAKMWNAYPWQERIQNIASPGTLLVDGTQDYSVPTNIHKLLRARIIRTDTTPNYNAAVLDVVEHLEPDLEKRSYSGLRLISHEPDSGVFRLEGAVQVPTGTVLRLNGEYELQHNKVTVTTSNPWFKDQFAEVGIKGLAYWGYKLGDDARAGTSATDGKGRVTYTGMLGEWMAGIEEMRQVEDFGALPTIFPDDTIGVSRSSAGGIFP
jgi:hypothetical protein